MKPYIRLTAMMIACAALACPQIDARGRNNSSQNRTEQHSNNAAQRPGNGGQRPGNNGNTGRPGNSGQHNGNNGHQPGNNGQTNRPGNGGQRPGNNGHVSRPGHTQFNYGSHNRPNSPAPRPGHSHYTPTPPHRPYMPMAPVPWHRPTPPPGFRPAAAWRPFSSILGIAFGSAINFSVNALINVGYTVTGYTNNAVYVSNVPMLNMMWTDGTLYYGNGGGLCGSEFIYSTPGYSLNRYNTAYNALVSTYGMPIRVTNANGVMTSTWWGSNNQFINLSYTSGLAANGSTRFFTTLSFGI